MSSSIDQRVVEMQFNNRQFESGIKDSLGSLENLKKGLGDLSTKDSGLAGLADGIEGIADKFSILGIIGITALQNIINKVIDLGTQMVKSFSIAPVLDGYKDYERKLTSVQTIMNATGESIGVVNGYFNELDEYADLTVYNLDDMTSAFAKFTNAGIGMDKSVPAIKGISNMVALAGQDANAASIAYYNLSQSMAGGFLTTMDYKSLNLANVATKEWKNQMIEGAVAAGTLKRNSKGLYDIPGAGQAYNDQQLFTEALKEGWATTDVLLNVLGDYGDTNTEIGKKAQAAAQDVKSFSMMIDTLKASVGTSWTDTFEIILGNLEESKELFSGLNDVIGGFLKTSSDARNELLQGWKDLGGRDTLIDGIANAFKGLVSVLKPIGDAFRDIFPPITSERLFELTEGFRDFTSRLIISDDSADKIKRTFAGLFAALDLVAMALGTMLDIVGEVASIFIPMGDGVLNVTSGLGDFIVALRDSAKEGNFFGEIFEEVINILTDIKSFLSNVGIGINNAIIKIGEYFKGFGDFDLSNLNMFSQRIEFAFKPFTFLVDIFKKTFDGIVGVFQWAWPIIGPIAKGIGDAISKFASSFGSLIRDGDFKGALDLLNTGLFAGLILGIKKFVDSLSSVTSGASGFLSGITSILDGVRGSLEAYQQSLKAKAILTIATAIGILAAALFLLSTIPSEKLTTALAGITVLFVDLTAVMLVLSKNMGNVKLGLIAVQMLAISAAVLILSAAMKNLATLEWEEVIKGGASIAILSAILVKTADAMSSSGPKMIKGSFGLIAMATAILILTQAVKQLGDLDLNELGKGLLGVGILLGEVAAFTNLVKPEKLISVGVSMIAMGAALLIMSQAVKSFAEMSWEEMAQGLLGLGTALAAVAGFTQLVKPQSIIAIGIAMIGLGAGLVIIAQAVKSFSGLSWEEMAKGLISLGVSLAAIGAFTQVINPVKLLAAGVAMIGLGAGLVIIAQAISIFAGLSWEEMARGLIALGGSLAIIAIGVNAMTGALPGAAALLIVSAALMILAPALIMLGSMDLINLGIALVALAGVFAIVGAAGLLLAPLVPVILALAVAIALLGVGVLAIGAGLLAFSAGLTSLAIAGTAGVAALTLVVTTLIGLIPLAAQKLAEGVISFAKTITAGMPAIMDAIRAIATGLIQIVTEVTPSVVAAILDFCVALLDELEASVPLMVDSGMNMLLGVLQGINEHIEDVIIVALSIITNFLSGIAKGIPDVTTSAVDVIVAFLDSIGKETPRIVEAGLKMMIDFLNGLADALEKNIPLLMDAVENVAEAIISGLIKGLLNGVNRVKEAAANLADGALQSIKDWLGIKSPSKRFEKEVGEMMGLGTIVGIENMTPKAAKAAEKMAKETYDKAKLWIKDYQNDTEYMVSEEIKMWEALSSKYAKLSKERVEIDKNINDLQDKMRKEREAAEKSEFEKSKKWIQSKKDLGQLSMLEEVQAWERVQSRYAEGTELRVLADKGLIDSQKQLAEEQDKLIEKMADAEKKYADAVDARAAAIVGTFGIFDELKEKEDVSSQTLTDNLRSQVDELRDWVKNLKTLAAQGIDEGLLAELEKMGPSANTEIKALVTMTEDELKNYEKIWKEKNALARDQAITELRGLRKDTQVEVAGIMDELSALTKIEPANVEASTDTSAFLESGKASIEALTTGYKLIGPKAITAAKDISTSVNNEFISAQPTFQQSGESLIGSVNKGFQNKQPDVISTAKTITQKSIGELAAALNNFYRTGQNSIDGFVNGMRSKIEDAARAAAEVAKRAYEAAMDELDIRSPSRKFFGLGKFTVMGFADGLEQFSYLGETQASNMGKNVLDVIKDSVSAILDFFDEDFDMEPTIRPVIDMSDIENGMDDISNLFGKKSFNLSGLLGITSNISKSMNKTEQEESRGVDRIVEKKDISFTQNNYSPKALSRIDIYRNTRNQFSAMKEVLG